MSYQARQGLSWNIGLKCLGLLTLTGTLDYVTGNDMSFFLFYLVPIIFTFRQMGGLPAVGMCILSIGVWYITKTIYGHAHHGWESPFWNTTVRFLIFLLVVSLLTVRDKLEIQNRKHSDTLVREKNARRRLEQEVLEASEREQWKIGHDLHDSLCQQLTASALAGKVLANKLQAQSRPEADAANQLAKMIEKGIELTRVLARSLRPIEMKEEGLSDALRELATSISRNGKVSCNFKNSQTVSLATVDANMHLYRIAQEAVNSAVRNGQARHITIELKMEDNRVMLVVTDDGEGLSSDAWIKDGLGRQIMNYRAGMINATLEVELLAQGGTRVTCRLPESESIFFDSHDVV